MPPQRTGQTHDDPQMIDANGLLARSMSPRLVRDATVGIYLEHLLIAAVVTILATRGYLQATGFPQIGGGGLHIAHMLWGGLLMLVSNVLLLSFLGRQVRRLCSFVAGIGFGLFIDELGKFITSTNDYFFQPTIGLIYVLLIVLFLVFRWVERRAPLSRTELIANAGETLVDVSIGNAQPREIVRSLRALDSLDATTHGESDIRSLRRMLGDSAAALAGRRDHDTGIVSRARQHVDQMLRWRWLQRVVLAIFALEAAAVLAIAGIVLVALGPSAIVGQIERSFAVIGHLVTSSIEFVLVLAGIALVPRAPLSGYQLLRLSLLVSIFLSQAFLFFEQQLGALSGLLINLVMLAVLDAMIASVAAAASSMVSAPPPSEQPTPSVTT